MNEEKKRWVTTIVLSVLAAIGLGVMIYFQREKVTEWRNEADQLSKSIHDDRELIKKTPGLVKSVIVQRETDAVVQEILSNEKDVLDLVRTLYSFAEDSGIAITSLKKSTTRAKRGQKQDFEKVGYTLSFEGDGFHLLSFLDKVETHRRFMSVTAFKLTAAPRNDYEIEEGPAHRVQLDLETYVYTPIGSAEEVRIDHYERKRDLLISEISKSASELRIEPYAYRGPRGRRDPWIDPRVAIDGDGPPPMPIEEQLELVGNLVDRTHQAELVFTEVNSAPNVISEMKARGRLEELLAVLDDDIRQIDEGNVLSYVLAEKRFRNQVVAVVDRLHLESTSLDIGHGPSVAMLETTVSQMEAHIDAQDFELALGLFDGVAERLVLAEGDQKLALVQRIRSLSELSSKVIEFEAIRVDIEGVAIYENRRPVALINGVSVTEGELVGDELVVRKITLVHVEFAFRGLVLARLVDSES